MTDAEREDVKRHAAEHIRRALAEGLKRIEARQRREQLQRVGIGENVNQK